MLFRAGCAAVSAFVPIDHCDALVSLSCYICSSAKDRGVVIKTQECLEQRGGDLIFSLADRGTFLCLMPSAGRCIV